MDCPLKGNCIGYFLPKETFTNVIYKLLFPVLGTLITAVSLYAWNELSVRTTMRSDLNGVMVNQEKYLVQVYEGQKVLNSKLDKLLEDR